MSNSRRVHHQRVRFPHLWNIRGGGIVDVAQSEHGLMKLQQIVTDEFLYEVGGHEASPSVEALGVEEAVLVGLAPDEKIVAALNGQLGLGIFVRRVLERLVTESGDVNVTTTLAGYVEHVDLSLGHEVLVRQTIQRIRQYAGRYFRHLSRTEEMMARRARRRRRRTHPKTLLYLIYNGLLLELVRLRLGGQLLHRLQRVADRLEQTPGRCSCRRQSTIVFKNIFLILTNECSKYE